MLAPPGARIKGVTTPPRPLRGFHRAMIGVPDQFFARPSPWRGRPPTPARTIAVADQRPPKQSSRRDRPPPGAERSLWPIKRPLSARFDGISLVAGHSDRLTVAF